MITFFREISRNHRIKFALITSLRSGIGLLDLVGLALLWYLTSSILNGSFSDIRLNALVISIDLPMTEAFISFFGLGVVVIFVLKGVLGALVLESLAKLTIETSNQLAERVIRRALKLESRIDPVQRTDFARTQHAMDAVQNWTRGSVFGYSVAISEGILVLWLFLVLVIVNPVITVGISLILGVTAFLLNSWLAGKIRIAADKQRNGSKMLNSDLSAALAVKAQLTTRGLIDTWVEGLLGHQEKLASGASRLHLFQSMPRFIMEIAVLLSVAVIVGASFLMGDFASNAPSAIFILGAAFRISGALLPLQSALNQISGTNRSSSDYFDFLNFSEIEPLEGEKDKSVSIKMQQFLSEPKPKCLVIVGPSGIGKSTAVISTLSDGLGDLLASKRVGFGVQQSALLPGGLERNISLAFNQSGNPQSNRLQKLVDALQMNEQLKRLGQLQDDSLENLSGGELTRVEILRAHYDEPDLIVLDEPTTGLDSKISGNLADFINASEVRYVIISHDTEFISRLSDKEILSLERN